MRPRKCGVLAASATIAESAETVGEEGVCGLQGAGEREVGSGEIENEFVESKEGMWAVSYTHLTLPTICSV